MKKIVKYLAFIFGIFITSCNSLDIKPLDILTDDDILTNEYGVKTYLAGLYRNLPMEDFNYYHGMGWKRDWNVGGAQSGSSLAETWANRGCDRMEGFGYWPYDRIREVNHFIKYFETNTSDFSDNDRKKYLAEAHFIRAFYYFGLVKRYGGVPIITEEQDPLGNMAELMVSRDTEEKVWDFVRDELKLAYELPETSERGRANRFVAAALMSRAMLYAGSIAKYSYLADIKGEAVDKNVIGISSSKANEYFREAYDAANWVITEGGYELYEADADKYVNYSNIFLNKDSKENILVRDYSKASGTEHCWDMNCVPQYICGQSVCNAYPTMNTVELFQELDIIDENGEPRRYNSLSEISDGLEPRLKAIIFFPGDIWNEREFDVQRALYKHFEGKAEPEMIDEIGLRPNYANLIQTNEHTQMYEDKLIIGQAGIATSKSEETQTGLYRRKYFNYKTNEVGWWTSEQSYIEFRLAEIMLNRAEAAFELGENIDIAKQDIKDIRERAGAKPIADSDIDLFEVRKERRRELAFENHLIWDLKRWRIAHTELYKTKMYALYPYYVYDEGKYIFLKQRATGNHEVTFPLKAYYEKIPQAQLDINENLYPQNPEY